ncbi:MAG: tetratricopeptide repeat protein [Pseudanabaenaceae cyanobacterium bins.39]|nr:tetratricopeptide repeat protein [Pseudanabaenaceae cyanobacterium bins.39]
MATLAQQNQTPFCPICNIGKIITMLLTKFYPVLRSPSHMMRLSIVTLGTLMALWGGQGIQAQTPTPTPAPPSTPEDYFKLGSVTRAIQLWSNDIRNGKEVAKSLYNRSQAYIVLKQYELALEDLNQLIKQQGINTPSQVYVIRGIALNELNRFSEAIEDFKQAERLQPSYLVYANRALAYQRSNQYKLALDDLIKAVSISPTAIARLNLANVRIQLGQFTEVVNEMTQLLAQEKTFFPAYLVRSIANYNLGKYEAAIQDCLFSLKIIPDQPEAYYYAGLSFAKLNRKEDASQNLIKAADLYLRQNQSQNYRQVLDKMSELNLQ